MPWLYLNGISTGDFHEAFAALLGPNAAGLSSSTISRLKADSWDEHNRWQRRDLSARRVVYIHADGAYFRPRMARAIAYDSRCYQTIENVAEEVVIAGRSFELYGE